MALAACVRVYGVLRNARVMIHIVMSTVYDS